MRKFDSEEADRISSKGLKEKKMINEKLIPEASELYPFYITFKCDDGHFDWGFYPAKSRREAVEQFLLSGVDHSGIHMIAKDGYKDPIEYIDEDEIQPSIHESEEDLTIFCAKLTEKETQLNKVFEKVRG